MNCNHYWQMNHGPEPEPNKCSLCGMLATHEYAQEHPHVWEEYPETCPECGQSMER